MEDKQKEVCGVEIKPPDDNGDSDVPFLKMPDFLVEHDERHAPFLRVVTERGSYKIMLEILKG